jgi:UDP-N-acetylmuramoyl-L-alanyl-D-glutamate--2,6-diaminopimelate ligase
MHQIGLAKLARHIPGAVPATVPDVTITGIALDSRQVQPGYLFVALEGGKTDGHQYIPEAIRRGAAAAVGSQDIDDLPVPYLRVGDGRRALAMLSAAFYRYPARELRIVGVTGTDGKTTTTNLTYSILQAAGIRAGMISTVNARIGERALDTGFHVTTPEAPDVQRYLAQMVEAGLTHAVLEATSHGLEQQRVTACEFDAAVVTNITHEHLDYHGSQEAYRAAKGRLFAELAATAPKSGGNPRLAVLNRDDESYPYLSSLVGSLDPPVRQVSYGLHPEADFRGEAVGTMPGGLRFQVVRQGSRFQVKSQLVGEYNISNCLAALAVAVEGLGVAWEAALQGVVALQGIPGRMEALDLGQDFRAIVDFAHTPNALMRALQAARRLTEGRVIAVFGSAGLRDREKRRMMAEISTELADLTVLTAEDPRTESLEAILAEMANGAESRGGIEGRTFWRVPDRGEAIRFAISLARPGDVVIACGKGHEQSMCFGEVEYPWDDRTAMLAALAEKMGAPGPEMPYLPTQE